MTGIAPRSASEVERGLDEMSAARIAAAPGALPLSAWNAATIPAEWLPVLAWALSVDIWNPDWTPALQRAAIADAYAQHRLKGTPAGVKRALDHIGAVYEIIERPAGVPYTETIEILNLDAITLPSEAALRALLDRVKRASVVTTISARAGASSDIALGLGAGAAALAPAAARLVIDEAGSMPANQAPTANAGPDQAGVSAGATVTLDGTASDDPDGTIASYAWTQTAGDDVALSDPAAPRPTFTAPTTGAPQTLTFELETTDDDGATDTDTVDIQVDAGFAEVRAVLPVHSHPGGNATRLLWDDTTDGLADLSPLSETEGAARVAQRLRIRGADDDIQLRIGVTAGSSVTGTGDDLNDAWEGSSRALTLEVPGLADLVLVGPNHADAGTQDDTEIYLWGIGANGTTYTGGLAQWVTDFVAAYAADNSLRATAVYRDAA